MNTSTPSSCCIVGAGPAGLMLGYLLARNGIPVTVLEKHGDFLRDFRGDTIHPSTLEIIWRLGFLDELLALRKEREAAVPVRYMNRYTGACYTLEQQPDAAKDTMVYVPLYDVAQTVAVPDIGQIRVGRLPTMNQDDYPGLGDWWVQFRIGDDSEEILARVYGDTPQEANSRAEALACRAAMLNQAPVKQPASNEASHERI